MARWADFESVGPGSSPGSPTQSQDELHGRAPPARPPNKELFDVPARIRAELQAPAEAACAKSISSCQLGVKRGTAASGRRELPNPETCLSIKERRLPRRVCARRMRFSRLFLARAAQRGRVSCRGRCEKPDATGVETDAYPGEWPPASLDSTRFDVSSRAPIGVVTRAAVPRN